MCDWTKSNYASEQFRTLVSRRKHESIRLSPNGNEPIVNQYATSMFDNSWQKLNEDFRRFGEDMLEAEDTLVEILEEEREVKEMENIKNGLLKQSETNCVLNTLWKL